MCVWASFWGSSRSKRGGENTGAEAGGWSASGIRPHWIGDAAEPVGARGDPAAGLSPNSVPRDAESAHTYLCTTASELGAHASDPPRRAHAAPPWSRPPAHNQAMPPALCRFSSRLLTSVSSAQPWRRVWVLRGLARWRVCQPPTGTATSASRRCAEARGDAGSGGCVRLCGSSARLLAKSVYRLDTFVLKACFGGFHYHRRRRLRGGRDVGDSGLASQGPADGELLSVCQGRHGAHEAGGEVSVGFLAASRYRRLLSQSGWEPGVCALKTKTVLGMVGVDHFLRESPVGEHQAICVAECAVREVTRQVRILWRPPTRTLSFGSVRMGRQPSFMGTATTSAPRCRSTHRAACCRSCSWAGTCRDREHLGVNGERYDLCGRRSSDACWL